MLAVLLMQLSLCQPQSCHRKESRNKTIKMPVEMHKQSRSFKKKISVIIILTLYGLEFFPLHHLVQTGSGAHPPSSPTDTGGS
jgi:hypothetical protein